MKKALLFSISTCLVGAVLARSQLFAEGSSKEASVYVAAVKRHADLVLAHGRDVYGAKKTPLFADGLDRDTLKPVIWVTKGENHILSNFGSQQTLFRMLTGLSGLTGDMRYRQAAEDAIRYSLTNLRAANGLGFWGGHAYYDLESDACIGAGWLGHELKAHYPYYQLMWQVDAKATGSYIGALWGVHITDWSKLSFDRHGKYEKESHLDDWNHEFSDPAPFFAGVGLSFCNAGSDLIYAATNLYMLDGNEKALLWARRMADMFEKTRNPQTGLVGYQYTVLTPEKGGDRAQAQFGPEFGPNALEGTLITPYSGRTLYGLVSICYLQLGEEVGGDFGATLKKRASESLKAYAKHAYDPATDTFVSLFSDGRRVNREDVKRPGYYWEPAETVAAGNEERTVKLEPLKPNGNFFWAYALAYRLTGEAEHWNMLKAMSPGLGLGKDALDLKTETYDPAVLLGYLELYARNRDKTCLAMAKRIGDNILARCEYRGWLMEGPERAYIQFDAMEPLALLRLGAVIEGREEAVPKAWANQADLHFNYDGRGKIFDTLVLWNVDRPRLIEGAKSTP